MAYDPLSAIVLATRTSVWLSLQFACLCVTRVIDSYYWSSPENLEILVDAELITTVNVLLLPTGGSPLTAANTFTQLLRALASSARSSPNITTS